MRQEGGACMGDVSTGSGVRSFGGVAWASRPQMRAGARGREFRDWSPPHRAAHPEQHREVEPGMGYRPQEVTSSPIPSSIKLSKILQS